MAILPIKATKGDKEATINFEFPENLDEMKEKWGEGATYDLAKRQAVVQIQARMRAAMDANTDPEVALEWRPGAAQARLVDPLAAAKAALSSMSPEDRQKWLDELGI